MEAQSSFCQLDDAVIGKLGIMYLATMIAAIFHDHRILENTLWPKHNPFSIKRYGMPALVNILFLTAFAVFAILGARLCHILNEGIDWTDPKIQW